MNCGEKQFFFMSTAREVRIAYPRTSVSSIFRAARVLILEDEAVVSDILVRKLSGLGYACESCGDGPSALALLSEKPFDLILADIMLPEIGGVALLQEVMRIRPDIAVILLTSVVDIEVAVDSLKHGAYDYITKPFNLEELSISVSRALEKRRLLLENRDYQKTLEAQVASRTAQLKEALRTLEHTYHSTLVALSKALDSRDADRDGYSLRVTEYSALLARELGMSDADVREVEQGVLLRDIGKIGIPDELLRKKGELNESEWALLRKHPEIGYSMLNRIKFLTGAAQLVLHHHEHYSGQGYPFGLKGEEINLGARIFAVADALEQLTSTWPARPAISFEAAAREIGKLGGFTLDPEIVKEFLNIPAFKWKAIRQEFAACNTRTLAISPSGPRYK
jgi:putative two-component system response regulator